MRRPKRAKQVVINGKKYITVRAAADRLDLTYSTLYQWSDRQRTPSGKPLELVTDALTGQRFISEDCVNELQDNRFQKGLLSLRAGVAAVGAVETDTESSLDVQPREIPAE